MIVLIENPKDLHKKLLKLKLIQQSQYTKIHYILYTNNEHSEKAIIRTIPSWIASKRINKILRELTKEVKDLYNENYKTVNKPKNFRKNLKI